MGSPVSVVVANLVIEDVEERALESFHSPPRFWKRCVDDTITALPRKLIAPFLDHVNDIKPSIRFTKEEESDRHLAFLDVLLCRKDDGTISTSVYRKATHTNQYLSFRSNHPTGTQGGSRQNFEDQSRQPVLLWCGADRGRKAGHRCTDRQWLPV